MIEYLHDPLGRRIAKKINGTITEKYLWQGMTRLLAVYDGDDSLLMRFRYADGRMPVAMTAGGATYYLAYDQVGSLKAVADASGNVVRKIVYDSFGNVISDSNSAFHVPFGFAGGLHDRDTGLVRFGYRDYDPDTGRWTAKDPIFFAGGDTDLYGYCVGDPINWVDSLGLISEPPVRPGKIIVQEGGVTVETYGTGDKHRPAHAHVKGGGQEVRIGPKGHKLKGNPEMSTKQRKIVRKHIKKIRKEINKVGRALQILDKLKNQPCHPLIMFEFQEQIIDNMIDGKPLDDIPERIY